MKYEIHCYMTTRKTKTKTESIAFTNVIDEAANSVEAISKFLSLNSKRLELNGFEHPVIITVYIYINDEKIFVSNIKLKKCFL